MKNLSNWRSVRLWETALERDLRQRHWLWLHGWCIGLIVLGLMWATAHLQLVMGSDSLALRYLVTLGVGYLGYLTVLRIWAGALLRRDGEGDADVADFVSDVAQAPDFGSGGGGDFGGGGAEADFDVVGDAAGGVLDVAAGADEGALVIVPVVAVFFIGLAVLFGAGWLMLLYFGWEVLLTVAVELAFSYVSARTAVRVVREGWLSAAVRLTWKPLLGALCCAVLLGAAIDYFIPAAHSLPHAVKLLRAM